MDMLPNELHPVPPIEQYPGEEHLGRGESPLESPAEEHPTLGSPTLFASASERKIGNICRYIPVRPITDLDTAAIEREISNEAVETGLSPTMYAAACAAEKCLRGLGMTTSVHDGYSGTPVNPVLAADTVVSFARENPGRRTKILTRDTTTESDIRRIFCGKPVVVHTAFCYIVPHGSYAEGLLNVALIVGEVEIPMPSIVVEQNWNAGLVGQTFMERFFMGYGFYPATEHSLTIGQLSFLHRVVHDPRKIYRGDLPAFFDRIDSSNGEAGELYKGMVRGIVEANLVLDLREKNLGGHTKFPVWVRDSGLETMRSSDIPGGIDFSDPAVLDFLFPDDGKLWPSTFNAATFQCGVDSGFADIVLALSDSCPARVLLERDQVLELFAGILPPGSLIRAMRMTDVGYQSNDSASIICRPHSDPSYRELVSPVRMKRSDFLSRISSTGGSNWVRIKGIPEVDDTGNEFYPVEFISELDWRMQDILEVFNFLRMMGLDVRFRFPPTEDIVFKNGNKPIKGFRNWWENIHVWIKGPPIRGEMGFQFRDGEPWLHLSPRFAIDEKLASRILGLHVPMYRNRGFLTGIQEDRVTSHEPASFKEELPW